MNDDKSGTGGVVAFVMLLAVCALFAFFAYTLDKRLVRIECAADIKPHRMFKMTENDCQKIGKD